MAGIARTSFALSICCLGLTLAACSGSSGAKQCDTSDTCPSGARCLSGICVANRSPVARIIAPGGAEAFALVALDGSTSADPDPGDPVTGYAWSARSEDAACPPPQIAATGPTAQVRFGCPGRYEVRLVASDAMGAASAPGVATIEVIPTSAAPVVVAAADVAVGHLCAGEPLVCRPATEDGTVPLGATIHAGSGVSLAWTVVPPPGRELDTSRRVTFAAGGDPASPRVAIETDGAAISGDWVFWVEASDAAGVLGAAAMRVSIGNEPPVMTADVPPSFHTFDAVGSNFLAGGALQVTVTDPDGDPLEGRSLTANHSGDGGATFTVEDRGDEITYAVSVPYREPSDAAFLIGGEGLERTVTLALQDVNGAQVQQTWSIDVGNRPPTLVTPRALVSVSHSFDHEAQAYTSVAPLSAWSDPDGDPLFGTPTGDPVCSSIRVVGGAAEALCSLPYVGAAAMANFAGDHDVFARPADPWAMAEAGSATTVRIVNHPPVLTLTPIAAPTACSEGARCCEYDPDLGRELCHTGTRFATAVVRLAGFASDPDGDPLGVTVSGPYLVSAEGTCEPNECAIDVTAPTYDTCEDVDYLNGLTVRIDDGAASVVGSSTLSLTCAP